jgi:type III restriction enzyme
MANLQEKLESEFGRRYISRLELPDYYDTSLSPSRKLRPYQEECFRYFLTYMNPENEFDGKQARPHLLFHMATGSGKTLMMAGAILFLYEQGYRNFLFFVDSTNIVEKTKDNFLNAASSKYLFAPQIVVNGSRVEIRKVDNFQGANNDCINLCLTTIQGLHTDLNSEHENALTYDDFSDQPVVLISDEAHHMNAATRRGTASTANDEHSKDWESTVMRIFNKDNGELPNVLLEFTATADLTDPVIANKYENKVIFDYPLKKFREDFYSKEVEVIESDLAPLDRALQAMILSQYKRKLFADIKQNIKPVVLLKSKTIVANKEIFISFKNAVSELNVAGIERIRSRAKDDIKAAFDYFDAHDVTAENLILELKEDFSEERLLLVDGNNISSEKQQLLNSLEDASNGIRAIFAVDMLNEGWDVLNLYDIVRLYDTRDAANNRPGKTTMQEAQLIGRGARYMPFKDPNNPALDIDKRKYDGDASNPLRVIEKLHYHSAHNPRYIQELHTALVQTGIIPDTKKQLDLFLKDDFKESRLYTKGLVFVNERKTLAEMEDDGTIGKGILSKIFKVIMPTGKMRSGLIFGNAAPSDVLTSITIDIKLGELGKHVLRSALNSFSTYNFNSLKEVYPQLKSVKEFIESDNYLAKLSVKVSGNQNSLAAYSQEDKLYIAKAVLKDLEPILRTRGKTYRGTKEFKPSVFNKVFRDKIVLNVTVSPSGDKEFGESMKTPKNQMYALDLSNVRWYAYNDNYGTSEEKALVKYIEGKMEKFEEKYDEIYLVRNEKDLKIYDFAEGRPFEPDFVLFLRVKGSSDKYDNLQLFIEPKGNNLLIKDKWKNDFLKQIKAMAEVTWCTNTDDYMVWGIPFFNENTNAEFIATMEEGVLEFVTDKIVTEEDGKNIPIYDEFHEGCLPLYSFRVACGGNEEQTNPSEEAVGWIDASGLGFKPDPKRYFVVYAKGNSMIPNIHNGDLCVFEWSRYFGGSRNGEIVLARTPADDNDYQGKFTIKKYTSEWIINEDGEREHSKIELLPLNTDGYESIPLDKDEPEPHFIVGIFKTVIKSE